MKMYRNPKWLRQQYQVEGKSQAELARIAGCQRRTVRRHLIKHQIPIRPNRKHMWNFDFFNDWSVDTAYVLGFAFADGSVSNKPQFKHYHLRLTQKEPDILKAIVKAVGGSTQMVCREGRGSYNITFSYRQLPETLAGYGLLPRKSHTMLWPHPPQEFLGHFVRGYFDGDGCITYCHKYADLYSPVVAFGSGSQPFLEGLAKALYLQGLSLRPVTHQTRCFILRYLSHNDVEMFYRLIYADCGDLYIHSKREHFPKSIQERS